MYHEIKGREKQTNLRWSRTSNSQNALEREIVGAHSASSMKETKLTQGQVARWFSPLALWQATARAGLEGGLSNVTLEQKCVFYALTS
jgi:hypothetical protein